MRKPYDRFLIASILLTVLYFWLVDKPSVVQFQEDQKDMIMFGALYTGLIFGILSLIYLCFKQK